MSFVDECRGEWKRLGVPDAIANEMAAELSADLAEAEAEGASPEDVLGSAVFDPRAFAASWAEERGIIGQASAARPRSLVIALVVALAVFLALTAAGAALLIDHGHFAHVRVAVARAAAPPRFWRVAPPLSKGRLRRGPVRIAIAPFRRVQLVALPKPPDTTGLVLLGVGLGGIAATLVTALVLEQRRRA